MLLSCCVLCYSTGQTFICHGIQRASPVFRTCASRPVSYGCLISSSITGWIHLIFHYHVCCTHLSASERVWVILYIMVHLKQVGGPLEPVDAKSIHKIHNSKTLCRQLVAERQMTDGPECLQIFRVLYRNTASNSNISINKKVYSYYYEPCVGVERP